MRHQLIASSGLRVSGNRIRVPELGHKPQKSLRKSLAKDILLAPDTARQDRAGRHYRRPSPASFERLRKSRFRPWAGRCKSIAAAAARSPVLRDAKASGRASESGSGAPSRAFWRYSRAAEKFPQLSRQTPEALENGGPRFQAPGELEKRDRLVEPAGFGKTDSDNFHQVDLVNAVFEKDVAFAVPRRKRNEPVGLKKQGERFTVSLFPEKGKSLQQPGRVLDRRNRERPGSGFQRLVDFAGPQVMIALHVKDHSLEARGQTLCRKERGQTPAVLPLPVPGPCRSGPGDTGNESCRGLRPVPLRADSRLRSYFLLTISGSSAYPKCTISKSAWCSLAPDSIRNRSTLSCTRPENRMPGRFRKKRTARPTVESAFPSGPS